jgi:hypothetical protein
LVAGACLLLHLQVSDVTKAILQEHAPRRSCPVHAATVDHDATLLQDPSEQAVLQLK